MLYLNGQGRYNSEFDDLWEQLVPASGVPDNVQGELIRAIGLLAGECYRNGNRNWGQGFEAFVDYLQVHLFDGRPFDALTLLQIDNDLSRIRAWGRGTESVRFEKGEDEFDRLTDRVVEWCLKRPTPLAREGWESGSR